MFTTHRLCSTGDRCCEPSPSKVRQACRILRAALSVSKATLLQAFVRGRQAQKERFELTQASIQGAGAVNRPRQRERSAARALDR